jgi:hypothetical protein
MEANNMKAIRDALAGLTDGICFHCDMSGDCKGVPCEKIQKAKAALSSPRLNCEVGTPIEQYKRFLKYCKKNTGGCDRADRYSNPCAYCFSQWAQMSYEKEGGAK